MVLQRSDLDAQPVADLILLILREHQLAQHLRLAGLS